MDELSGKNCIHNVQSFSTGKFKNTPIFTVQNSLVDLLSILTCTANPKHSVKHDTIITCRMWLKDTSLYKIV